MTRWAAVLAALTLARLAVAAAIPLAPDETYYWVWSRALAAGYLDHPPMVALWIRAGTALAGEGALGIRLLGPLSAALGSVLLADAAERLLPGRRAGIMAAALLNATLLFGVGTVIMTPDTPLLFFWTAALWAAVHAGRSGGIAWWSVVGLCAGLALASKYTAVFLWFGLALWILVVPSLRRQLRKPGPWIGGLVAVAAFLPVVVWNADHDWASFLRQGGRAAAWRPTRAIGFLGELVGAQFGLATPLVFLLCVVGGVAAARSAWRQRNPAATLLAALTVPATLVFLQHAIGDRVQGNWPAILYPAACIAAAGLVGPAWERLQRPAVVLGLAITAAIYVQAAAGVLPVPPKRDPIALQLRGWTELAAQVEAVRQQTGARFVAADQYALAGELAHALPADVSVIGVEARWALTALPPAAPGDASGLLVRNARRDDAIDPTLWRDVTPVGEAARGSIDTFRLYRVTAAPGLRDAVWLPRPDMTR
ncbi:MAG: glycosyltransferase family 39 protein [Acetobacteraceae bacterium]|nr:glycosyltransferase family 39 protein [Acetobacteraceae bacterium]